ncbi:DUF1707 domain-containing protein [Nocardioides oleivorans]|uniref:DUF1707 domain-containing protein n=1 Tax=Nocardioides oleivorans TaxID=273676 RepID=A0A4Q2RVL8_9ACTN|nr:DUF1707 domain-containing protein [Nocardioides oleivorans]RYB93230.1 DUF1707 domain-containing protein [Nocardioides oleivorans]
MAGPDMRARDSDRNEAIEVIEASWTDGQLTREEYDARTTQALTARTLNDLERLVRDLQEPGRKRVRASLTRLAEVRGAPAPTGTQVATAAGLAGFARRFGVGVVVVAVAAVAVLVVLPWLLRGSSGDVDVDGTAAPVDLLSAQGFRTFVDALEARSGDTVVFGMNVGNESYGGVTVPVDAASDRSVQWTWRDAGFEEGELTGTEIDPVRFDLSRIKPEAIPDLVDQAGALIEEPDQFYLTVRPDEYAPKAECYQISAHNRFSEVARLSVACSGRVLEVDPG